LLRDKLLAGVELNDGAVESACKVGDEGFEDWGELDGEMRPLYPVVNLGFDGGSEYEEEC
jgi:hypothetical protein